MNDEKRTNEIEKKEKRIHAFMAEHGYAGVLLCQQKNFFWATAGGGNPVMMNYDPGFQSVLFTENTRYILSQQVEMPRIQNEETPNLGFEYIQYNWWEENLTASVQEVVKGRIACDMDLPETENVNAEIAAMRPDLTTWEIERFRELGKDAGQCMEETCRELKPGMTECEIGGILLGNIFRKKIRTHVLLVGNDDRVHLYRHPIPGDRKLEKYVMVVLCAERYGLIAALTRHVHFGPVPEELQNKYTSLKNVSATINLSSTPGKTMGYALEKGIAAYADNGYPDEWQKHYQGGICGYMPREVGGAPGSTFLFKEGQALAWNPTITGTKIEDTYIIGKNGLEIITETPSWPVDSVIVEEGVFSLPEILVRP